MDIDEILGDSKNIDVIRNPFNKDSVTEINIYMGKSLFSGGFYFSGSVSFRNGQTQGTQKFDGDSLVDVFIKVRNFCMNLK